MNTGDRNGGHNGNVNVGTYNGNKNGNRNTGSDNGGVNGNGKVSIPLYTCSSFLPLA